MPEGEGKPMRVETRSPEDAPARFGMRELPTVNDRGQKKKRRSG